MFRRLTAIATWVLLLHLNFIATDLVCAQHHEMSGAGGTGDTLSVDAPISFVFAPDPPPPKA